MARESHPALRARARRLLEPASKAEVRALYFVTILVVIVAAWVRSGDIANIHAERRHGIVLTCQEIDERHSKTFHALKGIRANLHEPRAQQRAMDLLIDAAVPWENCEKRLKELTMS